jgi:iron complex outermembrane receptor protein/hemoglobin/transferrin/lactoferrin receptor protein
LQLDAWLFSTWIDHSIARVLREPEACPPETDSCRASRARLQLVNADGTAWLWGAEGAATVDIATGLRLRTTCSYAIGEGPTPLPGDGDATEPLSRVPPLNGTAEVRYANDARGFYVAGASRWALAQRRLATSDLSDARIPIGGTPGYVVLDMRAGYRYDPVLSFSAVFENVLDAAYRVHGSSIHGPGRGLLLGMVLTY